MKRFSSVNPKSRNKILSLVIAFSLGISVCAYADEAGDTSVFEEKGSKMDVLEESRLLRKQLEAMLSGNKKAAKAYESYKAESKKVQKPKIKTEVKPVIGEPDVVKAEHLGLAKKGKILKPKTLIVKAAKRQMSPPPLLRKVPGMEKNLSADVF